MGGDRYALIKKYSTALRFYPNYKYTLTKLFIHRSQKMICLWMIRIKRDMIFEFFRSFFKPAKESVHQRFFVKSFHLCCHFGSSVWSPVSKVSIHSHEFLLLQILWLFTVNIIDFNFTHCLIIIREIQYFILG